MPLLCGLKPFERTPDPPNVVGSHEKLFYIEESGECFSSFSDMMERLTVVHSNLWTCAVTRNSGLTLEEAFLSEQQAHKGFPSYGKRPILFIGYNYFVNASFTELVYGTYKIIRERYFLNEWVRYHVEAKAIFARVIEVIFVPPDDDEPLHSDYGLFPPHCYNYKIEFFDHIEGKNVTVCVSYDQVSRSTSYSSRNTLHKYFMEVVHREDSKVIFKKDEIERFEIEALSWDQIFVEPEPSEGGLKRKGRPLLPDNEEMNNELDTQPPKRQKLDAESTPKPNEPSDWDRYRSTEKEVRHEREKMAEERLKLWKSMELKDDLDLTDLKILPHFDTFISQIPSNEFGDVLTLYGFLCSFGSLLDGWNLSFTLKDLVHSIYANERQNKPLLSLICCLMRTRNQCLATEDYDEADVKNEKDIPDEYRTELAGLLGDEIKSRNLLLERIRCCHGASLNNIQVNETTISQHVLLACHTSGYCPRQISMEVRKELRGDLLLNEDELLNFSLENQELLDDLERTSICELSSSQRLKLLSAFTKSLTTYGAFRKNFQGDMLEMRRLTQRIIRLEYLERQYETDYLDTVKLMDQMYPEFKLKRNGHSKKVDESINKFSARPSVRDAINLTQMKTRFDYVDPPQKRQELRQIQQNVIQLKVREIEQEMSDLYTRLGCVVLGTDRVFRQYIYIENLSLLFIEGNLDSSHTFKDHCKDIEEESEKFQACTSDENCPIHACTSTNQWFSLTNDDTLNQLMSSLNPLGLREGPLLANLKVCVESLRRSLDSMSNVALSELFKLPIINEDIKENYHKNLFIDKLLKIEEKLSERSLLDERFSSRRIEWRICLQQSDTRKFCSENSAVFDGGDILILDQKQLDLLTESEILGVSLFQIANSLILECLKEPFVDHHKGDPIATTTFANWVHGLCNASSINELFFYLTSIENAIKWGYKVPKTAISCTQCGARGLKSTMIKCSTCSRPFHKNCIKNNQSIENWSCNLCVAPQILQSGRRSKPRPGHFLRLSTVGNILTE